MALLLGACATMPAPTPTPPVAGVQSRESLLRERVTGRWDALIRDDLDAAYGYMSPGSRSTITPDRYKLSVRRGAFRQAKIETVSCDAEACRVRLLVTYDHRLMKGITTPLSEAWVFDNGQAWFVFRE